MQSRKLIVINIDDEHQLSKKSFGSYVDIVHVRNETDLQKIMWEVRTGSRATAADVFAMDVNMKAMDVPDNLDWQAPTDVYPLGPLMALPFLMSGECTVFVPYSNYWRDAAVIHNAYVLFAVSMLRAASENKQFTLAETREYLESQATDRDLFAEAEEAMLEGIAQFRERLELLILQSRATVVNINRTLGRLATFQEAFGASKELPMPLADNHGPLQLQIRWESTRLDCIELSSLFADKFLSTARMRSKALLQIAQQLKTWVPQSVEEDLVYDVAVSCLTNTAQCTGTEYILHLIKRALKGKADDSPHTEFQIRRLVVEFAWVRAWLEELPTQRLRAVRRYLGLHRVDPARNDVMHIDGDASRKYLYLLTGKHDIVRDDPWRRPLKKSYRTANDAYQLNADEPACLTPVERVLCRRYALEVLDWEEDKLKYPAWMSLTHL